MILSLKKTLALGLTAALLVFIAVYAYRLSLPQVGPRVTITSPPLEFSMQLDKTEYGVGENMTIVFDLKNISNETISLAKGECDPVDPHYGGLISTEANGANMQQGPQGSLSGLFHFGFSIVDENGTDVYRHVEGWLQAVYEIVLEPGGYVKQTLLLDPVTQTLIANQLVDGHPLLSGTYQITAILDFSVNKAGVTLETPSITFTIK